jgi:hypothetical protein
VSKATGCSDRVAGFAVGGLLMFLVLVHPSPAAAADDGVCATSSRTGSGLVRRNDKTLRQGERDDERASTSSSSVPGRDGEDDDRGSTASSVPAQDDEHDSTSSSVPGANEGDDGDDNDPDCGPTPVVPEGRPILLVGGGIVTAGVVLQRVNRRARLTAR